jgi:hypothetical protein
MKQLTTEPMNETNHKVLFGDRLLGYFTMDIDGFYYFDFVTAPNGLWTSYSLRMVANLLEEMNKPHEDNIKEYFKNGNNGLAFEHCFTSTLFISLQLS